MDDERWLHRIVEMQKRPFNYCPCALRNFIVNQSINFIALILLTYRQNALL